MHDQTNADEPVTPLSVTIRSAGPGDADGLARLSAELGYGGSPEDIAGRLRVMSTHNGHEVLVAETADGTLVGWIHIFTAPRIESAGFAEIGGLVVDARHRRRGIGARLVAAAEETASRLGFGTLRVRSRIERGEAHEFYENRGFLPIKTQRVYERLVVEQGTAETKE